MAATRPCDCRTAKVAHDRVTRLNNVISIGQIKVSDLAIETIIGVYPRERLAVQTIYLDIVIDYDFGPAAANENLAESVDYHQLTLELTRFIQLQQFELLETLTVSSTAFLLKWHPRILEVTVTAHKPSALTSARDVSASFSQKSKKAPIL